jgi:ethanolamine ammonia-lyase large subunit
MTHVATVGGERFAFGSLTELLGRANEEKSGDRVAGLAARSDRERVAAKRALADLRVADVVDEPILDDEVTSAVLGRLDRSRLDTTLGHLTIGELRELILHPSFGPRWTSERLHELITPEVAAAVTKLMSNLDLVVAAAPLRTTTQCRNTMGQRGVFGARIQPNHPTDDLAAIAVSIIDGVLMGSGDAMLGVNPANDSVEGIRSILDLLSRVTDVLDLPTQTCVLAHVTTQLMAIESGASIDLMFQSVAGTELANKSFGVNLAMLSEAHAAVLAHHQESGRIYIGDNAMYFETGQGSALSAGANAGIDQLTCEARAQAVARLYDPFLVNSVVGFIGPEYLANGVEIARAGLEDHFVGKLMGLPMGVDVCFTNHVDADHNSNDSLLMQLALAGCNFIMGVPGGDDVMLNYQSTSFHDVASVRDLTGSRPAPEYEAWLVQRGLWGAEGLRTEPEPTVVHELSADLGQARLLAS